MPPNRDRLEVNGKIGLQRGGRIIVQHSIATSISLKLYRVSVFSRSSMECCNCGSLRPDYLRIAN
jgi:hypothetical protein